MLPLLTVLNIAKVLLLLGIGFFYFLGLGWLVVQFLFPEKATGNQASVPLLQIIPLAITVGFIVNYAISLVFQSLPVSLILGAIISIIGIGRFGSQQFQTHRLLLCNKESQSKWIGAVFIFILYMSPILIEPLTAWDARVIWFFHAKMIYAAGSFGASAGWQNPAVVSFSHVDYPNLVPGIAAQVAYLLGYWNEYIPKISIAFVLFPVILWLFTFARKSFTFVILILLFPFSFSIRLWDGHMDAYLAVYFSIAMLFLGRYVKHGEIIDFITCITCLVLLLYLKVEGLIALIAGMISLIAAFFLMGKSGRADLRHYLFQRRNLVAGAIVLLPYIVWGVYKKVYSLPSYFRIGNVQTMERLLERIDNHSYSLIANYTYGFVETALLLLGLLYFITIARKQPVPKIIIPALISAAIFWMAILSVYMLTPIELDWQLRTSADRTMLSVNGCIFVACYFILDLLENRTKTDFEEIAT